MFIMQFNTNKEGKHFYVVWAIWVKCLYVFSVPIQCDLCQW